MKKHLPVLLCAFFLLPVLALAQNTIKLTHISPSFNIPSDSDFVYTMSPGDPTISDKIDITNNSSTTHTYTVVKREMIMNPAGSAAYFCFGGLCFGATTYTSITDVTLGPGQSTSQLAGMYNTLQADFDEGTTQGYSFVKYTFFDVNNPSDSIRVGFKFNSFILGVQNAAPVFESASELYPNPATGNSSLTISLKRESEVQLQVINMLGEKIFSGATQQLPQGKHKLSVDCSLFNSGIYLVSIRSGENKIIKRLIIN